MRLQINGTFKLNDWINTVYLTLIQAGFSELTNVNLIVGASDKLYEVTQDSVGNIHMNPKGNAGKIPSLAKQISPKEPKVKRKRRK